MPTKQVFYMFSLNKKQKQKPQNKGNLTVMFSLKVFRNVLEGSGLFRRFERSFLIFVRRNVVDIRIRTRPYLPDSIPYVTIDNLMILSNLIFITVLRVEGTSFLVSLNLHAIIL